MRSITHFPVAVHFIQRYPTNHVAREVRKTSDYKDVGKLRNKTLGNRRTLREPFTFILRLLRGGV